MTGDRSASDSNPPVDLAEAIHLTAGGLAGIRPRQAGPAEEFLRGDTLFAVLEGPALAVRLRAELAEAAVRTPDAAPSNRGAGWVTLRPATLDVFSLDRARSWFESAWRYAAESDRARRDLS